MGKEGASYSTRGPRVHRKPFFFPFILAFRLDAVRARARKKRRERTGGLCVIIDARGMPEALSRVSDFGSSLVQACVQPQRQREERSEG